MRRYLLVVLAACGLDADTKPVTSLPESVIAVGQRMHTRYAAVQDIERGIVSSKLEDVRSAARKIASLEDPEVLAVWQPYLTAVRSAARDLAAADDIVSAARLTGELGRQCARCHQAINAKIAFRTPPKPDPGKRLEATMASHQWAVASMWEGLIGPSEERWLAGAKALQHAPLTFVAESGALGIADDVVLIRLFSRRAPGMKSNDERAELFGRLLGTCANCHSTIRDTGPTALR
jgi:hypothetical protein